MYAIDVKTVYASPTQFLLHVLKKELLLYVNI